MRPAGGGVDDVICRYTVTGLNEPAGSSNVRWRPCDGGVEGHGSNNGSSNTFTCRDRRRGWLRPCGRFPRRLRWIVDLLVEEVSDLTTTCVRFAPVARRR